MNNEEINRAIAEHLGWSYGPIHIGDGLDVDECSHAWWRNGKAWVEGPPNYCGDLNAMHEAEKAFTSVQCSFYTYSMREVITKHDASRRTWHATARQRAEAFLRTVGKWRGEE